MSFKFDFLGRTRSRPPELESGVYEDLAPAEEIYSTSGNPTSSDLNFETVIVSDEVTLYRGRLDSEKAAALLNNDSLRESDLVPGKYEGGFKLWEGAVDLCRYLCRTFPLPRAGQSSSQGGSDPRGIKTLQGKRVLELGCGHGLPAIYALLAGANTVHFQDYNKEVLQALTVPNVQYNLSHSSVPKQNGHRLRYFAGDWAAVSSKLHASQLGGFYDYIFTAETIYSQRGQECLLDCIKQALQPPHGVAYVAAKSYYFGVGGGTAAFEELVKLDGILECSTVWSSTDDTSTKREILQLNFPECIVPYFL